MKSLPGKPLSRRKYAKERVQFDKPIGSLQLIQAKLVDMFAQIESVRLLSDKAAVMAGKVDRGGSGKFAPG